MFGKTEDLVVVLLIVLLLFGAKKIPELAKSIGQSAREIKKGFNGEDDKLANTETPRHESTPTE